MKNSWEAGIIEMHGWTPFKINHATHSTRTSGMKRLAGGLNSSVDGFDIDKEIETSAVDIGNPAMPIKALGNIAAQESSKAPWAYRLVNWIEVFYQCINWKLATKRGSIR